MAYCVSYNGAHSFFGNFETREAAVESAGGDPVATGYFDGRIGAWQRIDGDCVVDIELNSAITCDLDLTEKVSCDPTNDVY